MNSEALSKKSRGGVDSVSALYGAVSTDEVGRNHAFLMLVLRSWITQASRFDSVSGQVMQTGVVDFMEKIANSVCDGSHETEIKDRIYRIVAHVKESASHIMRHTKDKILREHAMLPVYSARELDGGSVRWLSRQPGRTIREKLSGKPYVKAVRRRFSIDTMENRLVKAFLFRLEQVLSERQDALRGRSGGICDDFLSSLLRWLRSEDIGEIGLWGNLPPNNTLLQDKHYRKVLDGWTWLRDIDAYIAEDSSRVQEDTLSAIYWSTLSLLGRSGRFRIVQQPVSIDYDYFSINLKSPMTCYMFPAQKQDTITTKTARPEQLDFTLSDDRSKWEISNEKDRYLLQITSNDLLIKKIRGSIEESNVSIAIEPLNLKDISEKIISATVDPSFKYLKPNPEQCSDDRMEHSVVNLCSVRPSFTNKEHRKANLPFRLLQQSWSIGDGNEAQVDCGSAKAIMLGGGIKTVSMRSLFLGDSNPPLSEADKSRASMSFVEKLSNHIKNHIKADSLTYLVPDWINDFDLETIRRSVNFYFRNATPLPRSIAAIFAWQSSELFAQSKVQDNDFVLVVDLFDKGISITPIKASYKHEKELEKVIDSTCGISWERHPTILKDAKIHDQMIENLSKDGCHSSRDMMNTFGFEGLSDDAGSISFVRGGHWYHLSDSISDILKGDLKFDEIKDAINECVRSVAGLAKDSNVFILPIDGVIKKPEDLQSRYEWLGSSWLPIKGGQTLVLWQEMLADAKKDISLWQDHLPNLCIKVLSDGYYDDFYLVKNATITPQRNKTVDIEIKELFMLPKGEGYYSFPLLQGSGNESLHFVAYLKSPAFPLKEDVLCKLKMTYTYGEDNPYELKFFSSDASKANFEPIKVEWRPKEEANGVTDLPIPIFPPRKTWSDFRQFPKKGGGTDNLLYWCINTFDILGKLLSMSLDKELEYASSRRRIGQFAWGSRDKNGEYFCMVKVNNEEVFCHSDNFVENINAESLSEGDPVHLHVVVTDRGKKGYDISFAEELPQKLKDKVRQKFDARYSEKLQRAIKRMEKRPSKSNFSTIWKHGNSLQDSDAPDDFRSRILTGITNAERILESKDELHKELKNILFLLLCYMHKDTPSVVISKLLSFDRSLENLRKYKVNVALAIGDAKLKWQEELFSMIVGLILGKDKKLRSLGIEMLAIAIWRHEGIIDELARYNMKKIALKLNESLKHKCLQINSKDIVLCRHLELLLGMLRSRKMGDKDIESIFSPSDKLTQNYIELVDRITKKVICSKLDLDSRLELEFQKPKPEAFAKTPDLLYALRLYLTGDSGANSIQIVEADDGW